MLRLLLLILIAANGALLAFRFGYLDALLPARTEPQRMSQQINVDKIKLTPVIAPVVAPAASASTVTTSAAASMPASASASAAVPSPVNTGKLLACTEIGDFEAVDAKKVEPRLAVLALGERQSRRSVQEVASHIVYIPPLGSKEVAEKKAGELKRRGVSNYFVIQDNSRLRFGISLGVFKTETAAKNHLANLSKQGVKSARIGARSVTSSKFAYRLRDLDAATTQALDKIMAGFPEQERRDCP